MTNLIIQIAVVAIVLILLWWILQQVPLPDPIKKVITIVVVVLVCLWAISVLLGLSGRTFSFGALPG